MATNLALQLQVIESDTDLQEYVYTILDEVIAPMEMAVSFITVLITSQKFSFIQS